MYITKKQFTFYTKTYYYFRLDYCLFLYLMLHI